MKTALIIFLLIIFLFILIISIMSFWEIYKKAGRKGWESIIPIYNYYVIIIKICKLHIFWLILYFITLIIPIIILIRILTAPIAIKYLYTIYKILILNGLIQSLITIQIYNNLAKAFRRSKSDIIAMLLIPVFIFPIIAYSEDSKYNKNAKLNQHGIFKFSE